MARMTLADFDNELSARGFSGLDQPTRFRYINWGYEAIARRYPFYWTETSTSFALTPGQYTRTVGDVAPDIPNFRSVDKIYLTTDPYRKKLRPATDDEFFQQWLPLDLTLASRRSIPSKYYVWENTLYILPPPQATVSFTIHYHQRMTDLVSPGDTPLTPAHLDEAILLAAAKRAHMRVLEPGLAAVAQADLEEIFEDMQMDEAFEMEEQPDRMLPDNQWA